MPSRRAVSLDSVSTRACPQCGARNSEMSRWCGQCFVELKESVPAVANAAAQLPAPAVGLTVPELAGPEPVGQEQPGQETPGRPKLWRCSKCEKANPLDLSQCPACGNSIFESMGADGQIKTDPRSVLARGLLIPGGGHARCGRGLHGLLVGATAVFGVVFGAWLWIGGLPLLGALLVLAGVGVHGLGAIDAYRMASGQYAEVILRPKVVTFVFGGLFSVLLVAAWQAQGLAGR